MKNGGMITGAGHSVSIPDSILERQYYLEMYKFACVARGNTPPISLTGHNGQLITEICRHGKEIFIMT
jgi:hypothetical protein